MTKAMEGGREKVREGGERLGLAWTFEPKGYPKWYTSSNKSTLTPTRPRPFPTWLPRVPHSGLISQLALEEM